MWTVYILYSKVAGKTYVGFTNDVARRLFEHNISESKGYTRKYRPWVVIYEEKYEKKGEAMKREKQLKAGQGRSQVREIVLLYRNKTED